MVRLLIQYRSFFLAISLIATDKCSGNVVPTSPKAISGDLWLPRELGRFHLKDAGFVEVYETTPSTKANNKNTTVYADQYNLYITTFNAGTVKMGL